jgi:serine/threonine protein kinase
MAGGNLSQLTSPTKDEITITINQQLLAISYLHRMDITHRDIKPENVLVQQRRPDLITKLSDFGLSSETAKLVTFCGTDLYCAPEIEESYRKTRPKSADASYTNVVDVWSLGIVYMQYTIGLPPSPKPWNYPQWTRLLQSRMSRHRRKVGPLLPEMLQPDPKKRPSADDCLSQFPSCSSSFPAAMKASKRGRHQLSTIQEGPVSKIQMSAEPRKRARPDQSESKVQPEDEILDLFGSGWLRNSLCVGSQLAGQVEGDEAESDLFESNFCSRGTTLSGQAHLTAETIALRRSIESERDPGYQDVNEATISLGERQEIVRQLLRATREAEEVDQALHQDSTSDTSQFRFSGFL